MFKFFTLILTLCLASLEALQAQETGLLKPRDAVPLILPRSAINRPPPPEIHVQTEKFFTTLQQAKVEEAFQEFLKDSDQLRKRYNVDEFVEKTKQALLLYGSVQGFELYDNKAVGGRLLNLTYFVYLQNMPLRWRMVYYSADGQVWKLINLSVDDLLDQSILAD